MIYDEVFKSTLAFGNEKIILGSDSPHQIGDIGLAHKRIMGMNLSSGAEEAILSRDASKLLKL